VISGTANGKDGAHFHSGIENFSFTDSTNINVTPTTNINTSGDATTATCVMQKQPLLTRWLANLVKHCVIRFGMQQSMVVLIVMF
jgi:hypothetical protein